MKKSIITLSVTALVLFSNCSGFRTVSKPTAQVVSGTKVSFEKIMNPAFAKDYIESDIITHVQFLSSSKSRNILSKIPKGYTVFQVVPIGGEAKNTGFGGSVSGYHVLIPKSSSDMIFNLKPGDKIELRGGTRVLKGIIARSTEIIDFVAISIKKL